MYYIIVYYIIIIIYYTYMNNKLPDVPMVRQNGRCLKRPVERGDRDHQSCLGEIYSNITLW